MGCGCSCALKVSPVVDVDAADWNASYQKNLAHGGSITKMAPSQKLDHESFKAQYNASTGQLAEINGYKALKSLGKGAFGEVYLTSKAGEQFALKVLKQSALKKTTGLAKRPGLGGGSKGGPPKSALDAVKPEIATLKRIAHPNCVTLHEVIHDASADMVFLVLELVDGGPSQRSDAEGNPIPLPLRTIWSHTRHFMMGLEYLHMHGIVHRKSDRLD